MGVHRTPQERRSWPYVALRAFSLVRTGAIPQRGTGVVQASRYERLFA